MKPRVNVYAEDFGWLFEDLKGHFAAAARRDVDIIASNAPVDADAWICIRTKEGSKSPDLARTVVQIHDVFDDYGTGPASRRHIVQGAGAVVLTNPAQLELMTKQGVRVPRRRLTQPIGAAERFTPGHLPTGALTVGWVGRPFELHGVDHKGLDRALAAFAALLDTHSTARIELVGSGLLEAVGRLGGHALTSSPRVRIRDRSELPWASYPQLYRRLDVLLALPKSEWIPIAAFEAMACGVPVISNCWMVADQRGGIFVQPDASSEEIAAAIVGIRDAELRPELAFEEWTLEGWIAENVRLALELVQ